jgi:hypothetical protein
MKDILKNPVLYYIAIPVLAALWPILVFAVYLPAAKANENIQIEQYQKADKIMKDITTLEPDRLNLADTNSITAEFLYNKAVSEIASQCNIPSAKFKLNPSAKIPSGGQTTQSANVGLSQVDITTFARFISMIQTRWPNLQCTRISLDKKENGPDVWDISIDFKYYY